MISHSWDWDHGGWLQEWTVLARFGAPDFQLNFEVGRQRWGWERKGGEERWGGGVRREYGGGGGEGERERE